MKKAIALLILAFLASGRAAPVTNIHAFYRDRQVFVTWVNPADPSNVRFTLYRFTTRIQHGQQLSSA